VESFSMLAISLMSFYQSFDARETSCRAILSNLSRLGLHPAEFACKKSVLTLSWHTPQIAGKTCLQSFYLSSSNLLFILAGTSRFYHCAAQKPQALRSLPSQQACKHESRNSLAIFLRQQSTS
jgi:hypothetical protein